MKKLLLLAVLPILFACQREDSIPAASLPTEAAPVAVVASVASSVGQVSTAKSPETVKPVASTTPATVAKPVAVDKPTQLALAPAPVAPTSVAVAVPSAATVVPPAVEVKAPAVEVKAPAVEVKAPAVASDADSMALAKKRNCLACHMIDKKIVGPAWKDVAAKYRGDAGAQARMEAKIGKGGSGAWGSMAMPAQPQVTAEERAILARFILNLK